MFHLYDQFGRSEAESVFFLEFSSRLFFAFPFLSFSCGMKQELYGQLDALQSELFAVDQLVLDSESILSDTTAATSVQLSPRKAAKKPLALLMATEIAPLQDGSVLLHNVLDCLNDMAIQESEQIEECLAEVAEALTLCVAMNTYSVEKRGMFPYKR